MEKIGIDALDNALGGLPDESMVLLSGSPGSNKTVFALKMAMARAPALYIILEENKRNFIKFYGGEPWGAEEAIKKGDLILVDYPANEANQFFEQHNSLLELVNAVNAERIVVDSLFPIAALFEAQKESMGLLRFLETVRRFGKTSIITSLGYSYPYPHTPYHFEELVDIWFHLDKNVLSLIKYKGKGFDKTDFKYRISEGGIELY